MNNNLVAGKAYTRIAPHVIKRENGSFLRDNSFIGNKLFIVSLNLNEIQYKMKEPWDEDYKQRTLESEWNDGLWVEATPENLKAANELSNIYCSLAFKENVEKKGFPPINVSLFSFPKGHLKCSLLKKRVLTKK